MLLHRLPRVVLVGDSIRQGYESVVRAELAGVAHVWSPAENGQHSVNLLLNAWTWIVCQQPALVHLNAGMWDTRRVVRDVPGAVVPLDHYRDNVRRLITLTMEHTPARVIWATITPADDAQANAGHRLRNLAGRDAADIERYNAAAVEIARELGAAVNDLHGLVMRCGPKQLRMDDGVHFTAEGYAVLGRQVATAIRSELSVTR